MFAIFYHDNWFAAMQTNLKFETLRLRGTLTHIGQYTKHVYFLHFHKNSLFIWLKTFVGINLNNETNVYTICHQYEMGYNKFCQYTCEWIIGDSWFYWELKQTKR